jgi:putative ABC transport system ATP-binding protein
MIRIKNLQFGYAEGDFRLQVAEFRVEARSTTALIGPSGSGKTTLLNLIAGIALPRAGQIEVDGVDVTALSDAARRAFRVSRIGLVFQEFELLDYLNVLDNILLPYRINSALALDEAARQRAVRLAEAVGLHGKLNRYPARLSQGERQRVAVCRALSAEPALLLADEPTGNLDPANAQRVLDMLFELAGRTGTTVVAVTHDHGLLPRFQRVIDFTSLQEGTGGDPGPLEGSDAGALDGTGLGGEPRS